MGGEGGKVRFPPSSPHTPRFPSPQMAVVGVLCDDVNPAIPACRPTLNLGLSKSRRRGGEDVLQAGTADEAPPRPCVKKRKEERIVGSVPHKLASIRWDGFHLCSIKDDLSGALCP